MLLFVLCPADAHAQTLDVAFVEELRIGGDEDAAMEYLLQSPRYVVANDEGDIFIADDELNEVRVFNSTGEYIRTLGRAGQGPGEFGGIASVSMDHDGSLLISDWSTRRITRFRQEGAVFETIDVAHLPASAADAIIPYGDGYLLLQHWEEQAGPQAGRILHLYTSDLKHVRGSFARASLFYNLQQPLEALAARGGFFMANLNGMSIPAKWRLTVDSRGNVFFSKTAPDGALYRFSPEKADVWRLDLLWGRAITHSQYEDVTAEWWTDKTFPYSAAMYYEGNFRAMRWYTISAGLHALPDGTILHFYRRPPPGDIESSVLVLAVERFDASGQLTGYGVFDPATHGAHVDVAFRDAQGRFYLVERFLDRAPLVRRVRLQIIEEPE